MSGILERIYFGENYAHVNSTKLKDTIDNEKKAKEKFVFTIDFAVSWWFFTI